MDGIRNDREKPLSQKHRSGGVDRLGEESGQGIRRQHNQTLLRTDSIFLKHPPTSYACNLTSPAGITVPWAKWIEACVSVLGRPPAAITLWLELPLCGDGTFLRPFLCLTQNGTQIIGCVEDKGGKIQ